MSYGLIIEEFFCVHYVLGAIISISFEPWKVFKVMILVQSMELDGPAETPLVSPMAPGLADVILQ